MRLGSSKVKVLKTRSQVKQDEQDGRADIKVKLKRAFCPRARWLVAHASGLPEGLPDVPWRRTGQSWSFVRGMPVNVQLRTTLYVTFKQYQWHDH